ncbi:MAG: methyltransferase domain-containing protein [Dehalococcoidia bacterium]
MNLDTSQHEIDRTLPDLPDRFCPGAVHHSDGRVDLDWDDDHVLPPKVYPDIAHLFRRMTDVTVAAVGVAERELVLDIGCGRAVDAIELAGKGGLCSGLEPSGRMISHARQHISQNGASVNLARGVSAHLPFKTNSFDKILCKGALDHFCHPDRAIAEMARVLKPQGRAVIATANFESLGFRAGRRLFWLMRALSRDNTNDGHFWQIPDDHTIRLDYGTLKRLVLPHFTIERAVGISLLVGLPGWSSLLDRLPQKVCSLSLRALDGLARHLPSLSNVIVIRCVPRANPTSSSTA